MEEIKYINFEKVMKCLLSKDKNEYVVSIIQKLNWNIDDFNGLFCNIESRKDVVYFIVLSDWIVEACNCIYKLYEKYAGNFVYSRKEEFEKTNKQFKAIRSFIVAHPLNTDRHTEFGYDGKKECIDIKLKLSEVEEAFSDYDRRNADFYLSYYDNDKSYAYKNEGHDYSEIYRAVYYNVERMLEFEKYLSKIRKKDLEKYQNKIV